MCQKRGLEGDIPEAKRQHTNPPESTMTEGLEQPQTKASEQETSTPTQRIGGAEDAAPAPTSSSTDPPVSAAAAAPAVRTGGKGVYKARRTMRRKFWPKSIPRRAATVSEKKDLN